ncbi:hypothetical protein CCACVL1_10252 [Corchorus capsularis]|uniref:Uncharacterized protein n=1 Tax=Corchorus capsularis TaxID=210143 RepID=A0A1R3IS19_COCAP|nr:hypothetical protein CCACVL1_10252 [Corchorus capsularis]
MPLLIPLSSKRACHQLSQTKATLSVA